MKLEEILVVEDNETMRLGITESLKREGYRITSFDNGIDALKSLRLKNYAAAVLDLKMEPIGGIEILSKIKDESPDTEVILISAYGTVEAAVQAMKIGAFDFLSKPFSPDELRVRVKKAIDKYRNETRIQKLIEANRMLNEELSTGFDEVIGNSEAIKKVLKIVEQVANSNSTVLIQGESGTGKELIARAIHQKSSRSDAPFIRVNCASLNDNLIESELFGHEKGAFTGALKTKKGRFELADSGTLFLDEIGDVSHSAQIKLLRILQEGEFERVGGELTIKTDVRIIAATNQNLQKLISEGKFREDLYYRLNVIPIQLPPLRDRKTDIPLLVEHFLVKISEKNNTSSKKISDDGLKLLIEYFYPGNIRELENLIERLHVISAGELIGEDLIAGHLNKNINVSAAFDSLPLEEAVNAFEKSLLIHAMKKSDGIKNRAAKLLGIGTSLLYYKLNKHGLS
jgi:two-component system, NtrC family, response regulator HydG